LDFIDDDKIDLMICDQVADEFDGVGLLEFLEVENEIVIFTAIDGDRFCQSFDGAVKGNDDGEFGVNDSAGKYGGYGFPCANA